MIGMEWRERCKNEPPPTPPITKGARVELRCLIAMCQHWGRPVVQSVLGGNAGRRIRTNRFHELAGKGFDWWIANAPMGFHDRVGKGYDWWIENAPMGFHDPVGIASDWWIAISVAEML